MNAFQKKFQAEGETTRGGRAERTVCKAIQRCRDLDHVVSALDKEVSKEVLGYDGSPSLANETGGKHGVRRFAMSAMKSDSMLVGSECK